MSDLEPQTYRFGGYTLEARERRLLGNGAAIPLKPRVFDTLLYLVERAGHLVPKEELLAKLWPDSVVEESTLAKNVWLIRRALAEIDGETRFIETVPRIGYRFVAPVERLDAESVAERRRGARLLRCPPVHPGRGALAGSFLGSRRWRSSASSRPSGRSSLARVRRPRPSPAAPRERRAPRWRCWASRTCPGGATRSGSRRR